jgi:hypothetical protein
MASLLSSALRLSAESSASKPVYFDEVRMSCQRCSQAAQLEFDKSVITRSRKGRIAEVNFHDADPSQENFELVVTADSSSAAFGVPGTT